MKRLGAEVEDDLYERFTDFAHQRKLDHKQVIVAALEEYMGVERPERHLMLKHERHVRLLFDILEDGTAPDVDVTLTIMKRIAGDVKKRPKRKK